MKPHMKHIQETLVKKQAAEEAKDIAVPMAKYRRKMEQALRAGYSPQDVSDELENEIRSIMESTVDTDDPLFKQGEHNAKVACITALRTLIAELKGEINAQSNIQS